MTGRVSPVPILLHTKLLRSQIQRVHWCTVTAHMDLERPSRSSLGISYQPVTEQELKN